jgi:hypothetical protein
MTSKRELPDYEAPLKSDLFVWLRDRENSKRYDRKILTVGVTLGVIGTVMISFSILYALAICAVPNFI